MFSIIKMLKKILDNQKVILNNQYCIMVVLLMMEESSTYDTYLNNVMEKLSDYIDQE